MQNMRSRKGRLTPASGFASPLSPDPPDDPLECPLEKNTALNKSVIE